MISILIPVYNHDIRKLVQQLNQQASDSNVLYEIIARDDGSKEHFKSLNRTLVTTPCFRWIENMSNKGRSTTRNLLAKDAQFEFLIFLDCDVQLIGPDFLSQYLNYIKQGFNGLVSGGCKYEISKPAEQRLVLHWTYGSKVESRPVKHLFNESKKHFHSVNFMVNKEILLRIPFQESISTYGHEDTLWEYDLITHNIKILHIPNPVLHLGLNSSRQFLRNTSSAIKNIIRLNNRGIKFKSSLLRLFFLLNSLKLDKLYFSLYKKIEKRIVANLMSNHPIISLLSVFKLGLFIRFYQRSKPRKLKSSGC